MDELLASLDTLAGGYLTPLFGPALLDRLGPLLVAQNRLAAEVGGEKVQTALEAVLQAGRCAGGSGSRPARAGQAGGSTRS